MIERIAATIVVINGFGMMLFYDPLGSRIAGMIMVLCGAAIIAAASEVEEYEDEYEEEARAKQWQ
ncbi:MAG: hypothetical protein E6672_06265 [Negativicoccus succinicivorans]|nr:hypothetical protein [Negativicoccus succinicivorans]